MVGRRRVVPVVHNLKRNPNFPSVFRIRASLMRSNTNSGSTLLLTTGAPSSSKINTSARPSILKPNRWSPPVGVPSTFLAKFWKVAAQTLRKFAVLPIDIASSCACVYVQKQLKFAKFRVLFAGSRESRAETAYAHRVDRLVSLGGQGSYEDACKIVVRNVFARKSAKRILDPSSFPFAIRSSSLDYSGLRREGWNPVPLPLPAAHDAWS